MIYIIPKNIDSDNKKVLLVKKIHTNKQKKLMPVIASGCRNISLIMVEKNLEYVLWQGIKILYYFQTHA